MLVYITAVFLYCYALSRLVDAVLDARPAGRSRPRRGKYKQQGKAHV